MMRVRVRPVLYPSVLLPLVLLLAACDGDGPTEPGLNPCTTLTGLVVLETQADVDAMADLCVVAGGLEIRQAAESDDPITSLAPLSRLRRVGTDLGGSLRILGTSLTTLAGLENVTLTNNADLWIEGNAELTSLAALGADAEPELSQLFGVRIWRNAALTDLTGVSNLIQPGGASVAGVLSVWSNASLTSLTGLERLSAFRDLVAIESNPSLESLDGLPLDGAMGSLHLVDLPFTSLSLELGEVRDALRIDANHPLTTLSIDVQSVGHTITLSRNTGLTTLDLAVDRAPRYLAVYQSHPLTSFDLSIAEGGLDHFSLGQAPDLTTLGTGAAPVTVHGGIALYDTGLANLDTFAPAASLPGAFILVGNAGLEDIEAFAGVTHAGAVQVDSNPALCVPAWVHDIVITGGTGRSVSGNLCD